MGRLPFLKRNIIKGYKMLLRVLNPLLETKIEYPFLDKEHPYTPGNIVAFLFLLHERKNLKPTREFRTYLREAKLALDKYGGEQLVLLMLKAAETSEHHWGFNYVRRLYEDNAGNDKERSN